MIRIAILDDHPALVAGLTAVLRGEPGLVPVGAANHDEDLWPLLYRTRPDIVMLDYHLPRADGLQLCRRIAADPTAPKVVLYTAYADPILAVGARIAGAHAIASKAAPAREVFELLRLVARGERVLPDPAVEHLQEVAGRVDEDDLALLSLLLADTSVDDICSALQIEPREVAWRTERILGRLRLEVPVPR